LGRSRRKRPEHRGCRCSTELRRETRQRPGTLVAGPPEVRHRRRRILDPVDLLPRASADVSRPDLVRARAHREAEGVPQAFGDDPAGVRVRARERVPARGGARRRIDPQDGAVERRGVTRRAQVLGPQGPALAGRRAQIRPRRRRRIAAGVALLPVVVEGEARALAARDVELPVGAEDERSDRMARVLLAPIVDQDLLRPGHDVAARRQAGETTADDAAAGCRTGRRWARVRVDAGRSVLRRSPADVRVVRVEHVDVRARREIRVERHSQQPAIPEVVDVPVQVREDRRRCVRQVVEDLDHTALLGYEHAAVGREAERRGIREPAEEDAFLKGGGKGRLNRRGGLRR
jgi:hypothetical protein